MSTPLVDNDASNATPGAGLQWPLPPDWQKCVVSAEALDAHFDALSRALSQRKGPGRSKLLERAHRAYASALVEELEIAVEFYGKTEKKLQAIHCRARAGATSLLDNPEAPDPATARNMLLDLKRLTADLFSLKHFSLASCHELGVILARHDQISGLTTRHKFMEKIGSQPLVQGTRVKRMLRDCHELAELVAAHTRRGVSSGTPGFAQTPLPPPSETSNWIGEEIERPLGLGAAGDASPSEEKEARILLAFRHGTPPISVSPSPPPRAAASTDSKKKRSADVAPLVVLVKRACAAAERAERGPPSDSAFCQAQPPLAQPLPRLGSCPPQAISQAMPQTTSQAMRQAVSPCASPNPSPPHGVCWRWTPCLWTAPHSPV